MPHNTQREFPRIAFFVAAFSFIVYSVMYAQGVYDGPNVAAGNDSVRQMPVPANPKLPTLFLIGDSTVRNGHGDGANGQWGWGEPLVEYFDLTKINVVNRALGGRSSRTFLTQGHWDIVKHMLKRGDFVMMQFGHNDGGPLDDTARARGTLPGVGDETHEIDNPITKRHEIVHTFGWYLKKFIAETRAAGATPIVCSFIPRKIWKGGKIFTADDYGKWAAEVAASDGALFIDLNEIIAQRYNELGPERVEPLFGDAHTHTSRAGAELNAQCVIAGLKGLKHDPLKKYFSPLGKKRRREKRSPPDDAALEMCRNAKCDSQKDVYASRDSPRLELAINIESFHCFPQINPRLVSSCTFCSTKLIYFLSSLTQWEYPLSGLMGTSLRPYKKRGAVNVNHPTDQELF